MWMFFVQFRSYVTFDLWTKIDFHLRIGGYVRMKFCFAPFISIAILDLFVNYRMFSLSVKDIRTEYSFEYFLFWKNFNFIGKIWLSLSASKICGYSHTLYNSLTMRFERCKIFKYFYNNHQHIWKDCGLNYSFFLKWLNYVKYIIHRLTTGKVHDYKNNGKNSFLK